MLFFDNSFVLFDDDWLLNLPNDLLMLLMNDGLVDLSYFLLVDDRLMVLMNDVLHLLMDHILVVLDDHVLMVLMNHIAMVLFDDGGSHVALHPGWNDRLVVDSWHILSLQDGLLIVPDDLWGLFESSLNHLLIGELGLLSGESGRSGLRRKSWLIAKIHELLIARIALIKIGGAQLSLLYMEHVMMLEHLVLRQVLLVELLLSLEHLCKIRIQNFLFNIT
jgi:hypothetical protein